MQKRSSQLMRLSGGCLVAISMCAHAQQDSGGLQFEGRLKYVSPCSSDSSDPPFSGSVTGERISGRAARGKLFDWTLKPDGSFAGSMELRSHRLGTKVQMYTGKVEGDKVHVKVVFIVPGYQETRCEAAAILQLQPAKPSAS